MKTIIIREGDFCLDHQNHFEAAAHIDFKNALEQSNTLIQTLSYTLPQIILILSLREEVLFANYAASMAMSGNPQFLRELRTACRQNNQTLQSGCAFEFICHQDGAKTHYSVSSYPIVWEGKHAQIRIINGIAPEKDAGGKSKADPTMDKMTNLSNRMAGIMQLNKWLDRKQRFTLCVANLDNLKYVNNLFGREEGDRYIQSAARRLVQFGGEAVVSRYSGDEFLLLAPDWSGEQATERMVQLMKRMQEDIADKPYYCSISYGVVEVASDNSQDASELLSIADERMVESKLENKRKRSFIV